MLHTMKYTCIWIYWSIVDALSKFACVKVRFVKQSWHIKTVIVLKKTYLQYLYLLREITVSLKIMCLPERAILKGKFISLEANFL